MNEPNGIRPDDFTERVMVALAPLPGPSPTRTFVEALRTGAPRDALAALAVAWHLGTVRSWPVSLRVRARSFALVLAALTLLGTGSLVAAAAVHVVASPQAAQPSREPAGALPAAPDPTPAGPLDEPEKTPAPIASEPVVKAEPSAEPAPPKRSPAGHDKATTKDGSTRSDRPRRTDDPEDRGGSPRPGGDDGEDDTSGDEDDDGADEDRSGSGGDDGSDEEDSAHAGGSNE